MLIRTHFLKIFLLTASLLFLKFTTNAQQINLAVKNAYIITRMAEKFHLQPRPLNDEFSSNIFTQLLKQTDEDKIFFTLQDITLLSKYKLDIDNEIINRQSTFLSVITKIYGDRIRAADSMITVICKTPFNFSLPEKITVAEDTSYPLEKDSRLKLYKRLKSYTLDGILDNASLSIFNALQLKKYVDSAEPVARHKAEKVFKHSISMMLQGAGGIDQAMGDEYCKAIAICYDPHTEYFPETEKENFEGELGDKQMVFGFSCKEDDDGLVKIENIAPGSPAFKSGQINKGDKILSIQWGDKQPIDVSTGGLKQLYDVIAMSNHDKATLKIKKQDGSERLVILFKAKMEETDDENKVKSFLLKGSKTIGFISLPAFYQDWDNDNQGVNGCANDVAKEILKLKDEHIEGLIIDLRYNGGGSMEEAIELAGIFIDVGPVGMEKERGSRITTLKDMNRGTIYDGPLMFMVNGYTASAAEVVSGTLQDYNRAVVVGTTTYGKATAQVILPMDTTISMDKNFTNIKTDSYFKVTVSELFRVNGTTAQAKGVEPDIVLPDMLETHAEHESDNPYVLLPSPIDANKYFKPYPVIDVGSLRNLADRKMDSSLYFTRLKNYIALESARKEKKDESLQLSLAFAKRNDDAQQTIDTSIAKRTKPSYTVDNNLFEKKQLQVDNNLKELNDQWIKFLAYDPYLQICYDMILLMTK
jgi:carboxyl-terminal processing protease